MVSRTVITFLLESKIKKIALVLVLVVMFALNAYADNYALHFDGVDDYLVVPDSDDWTFGLNPFTIDFWIKRSSLPSFYIIDQYQINTYHWRISTGSDTVVVSCTTGGTHIIYFFASYTFSNDNWYNIAVVRETPTQGGWHIYINGENQPLDLYTGSWGALFPDFSGPLYIGAESNLVHFLDGYIDEVRIWDVARTEQEIQYWKDWELYGSQPDLVAYWNFNEGSGQVLGDLSGNGHNGTIYGAQWVGGAPVGIIPEPSTLLLFGFSLLGAGFLKRRAK